MRPPVLSDLASSARELRRMTIIYDDDELMIRPFTHPQPPVNYFVGRAAPTTDRLLLCAAATTTQTHHAASASLLIVHDDGCYDAGRRRTGYLFYFIIIEALLVVADAVVGQRKEARGC